MYFEDEVSLHLVHDMVQWLALVEFFLPTEGLSASQRGFRLMEFVTPENVGTHTATGLQKGLCIYRRDV